MKKLLLAFGLLIVGLVILMVVQANTAFDDVQLAPAEDLPQLALDEDAVVQRFAASIRMRTISHDDRSNFDADAFRAFHDHLRQSFPLVHDKADITIISDYSLVFHVAGSDPALKPVRRPCDP